MDGAKGAVFSTKGPRLVKAGRCELGPERRRGVRVEFRVMSAANAVEIEPRKAVRRRPGSPGHQRLRLAGIDPAEFVPADGQHAAADRLLCRRRAADRRQRRPESRMGRAGRPARRRLRRAAAAAAALPEYGDTNGPAVRHRHRRDHAPDPRERRHLERSRRRARDLGRAAGLVAVERASVLVRCSRAPCCCCWSKPSRSCRE